MVRVHLYFAYIIVLDGEKDESSLVTDEKRLRLEEALQLLHLEIGRSTIGR